MVLGLFQCVGEKLFWERQQDDRGQALVLSRFIKDLNIFDGLPQQDCFPTTIDLIGYIREITPDSLQYVVTDLLEKIILYENKVEKAEYSQINGDNYQVILSVSSKKLEADSWELKPRLSLMIG